MNNPKKEDNNPKNKDCTKNENDPKNEDKSKNVETQFQFQFELSFKQVSPSLFITYPLLLKPSHF